jgi:hypothetical protein
MISPTVFYSQWPRGRDAGDDDAVCIMHGLAGSVTNDLFSKMLLTSLLEPAAVGCHSEKEDAILNTSSAILYLTLDASHQKSIVAKTW